MNERLRSRALWIALIGVVLVTGFLIRGAAFRSVIAGTHTWKPWSGSKWTRSGVVTLYFADGPFLFPVSRRMAAKDELPSAALQALLDGPNATTGLARTIPEGVTLLSIKISDGIAHVDLSGELPNALTESDLATSSIIETLTALPGIDSVAFTANGRPWGSARRRTPLLYFSSANGLVAVSVSATTPRDAVVKFLAGPSATGTIGLPADVRLLKYDYDPSARSVSLNFTYTPSLRNLALEAPDRMRSVLLGLIASLTEFRDVESVQIDFDGHTRLGVGQCSDLLRTRQPRPELLNDERLLGR